MIVNSVNVFKAMAKELTLVEEEAKEVSQEEDGAGASGSDISVDSELDYFIQ